MGKFKFFSKENSEAISSKMESNESRYSRHGYLDRGFEAKVKRKTNVYNNYK